jgi:hypothetical protein
VIGIVEQRLDEIEHVAPAAAAPAPEPLDVVSLRTVDAQGGPVIVMERTQGGPAAAPDGVHGHTTGLKQVCNVDPLPQRRPKIVERPAHETRIALVPLPGTASGPSSVTGRVAAVRASTSAWRKVWTKMPSVTERLLWRKAAGRDVRYSLLVVVGRGCGRPSVRIRAARAFSSTESCRSRAMRAAFRARSSSAPRAFACATSRSSKTSTTPACPVPPCHSRSARRDAAAGGGEPVAPMEAANGSQQPVDRGRTDVQQGGPLLGRDRQLIVPLEGLQPLRQIRCQAFGAEEIAGFPQLLQDRAQHGPVFPGAPGVLSRPFRPAPQDPDGDFPMAAGSAAELVQEAALVAA